MRPTARFMTLARARKTSVFLALASTLALFFAVIAPTAGAASGDTTLTVSVGSAGFQPATTGSTCAELQVGQAFPVDVRVENVDNLMAYELRVTYDGTILALEEADFEQFLVSTPPNGQIFPSLFEAESANSYFIAAAETSGSADSGSGVLARLQMRAIGEGVSEISIQTDPSVYGPRLTDNKGKPIADNTGDGIFDGTVLSGTAVVNESCFNTGGEDPPNSNTDPDSGAEPGGGNDPGTGGGLGTGAEDSTAGSGNGPVDVAVVGGGQDGAPADPAGAGDSGASGDSESGDDKSANEGTDTDDGGQPNEASNAAESADGSSAALLWYALIAIAALAVLAALGLALKALRAP